MEHRTEDHPLGILMDKYSKGTITEKETLMLEGFMERYGHDGSWPMELGSKTIIKDALYKMLEQKIRREKTIGRNRVIKYTVAASLAASIMLFFGIFSGETKLSDPNDGAIRIANTSSAMDSLLLSDGTMVYLGNNTVVEYPETFNGASREVALLEGSAYFDVVRDEENPFLVNSGGVTTKVLGTAFTIVKKDTLVKVTVSRGKVNVGTLHNNVDLVADQQAVVNSNINVVEKLQVDAGAYSLWMAHTLEYSDIPLGELSTIIEMRYGLPFHFQDATLRDYRVKVAILRQDKVETIISKLNFITNINFKIEEHVITVNTNN